jgi:hypothetical protein
MSFSCNAISGIEENSVSLKIFLNDFIERISCVNIRIIIFVDDTSEDMVCSSFLSIYPNWTLKCRNGIFKSCIAFFKLTYLNVQKGDNIFKPFSLLFHIVLYKNSNHHIGDVSRFYCTFVFVADFETLRFKI